MNVDYASITLPKKELAEIHRGLLTRFLVENEIRREEGLEEGEYPKVLEALEHSIGMEEEEAHALFHEIEEELWDYAWCSFTDEWAWFRARQDALKELSASAKRGSGAANEALDRKTEERYREKFERYIQEIDMREIGVPAKKEKKRASK